MNADKLADVLREANDLLCDFQSHFGVLPPDDKDDRAAWDRIERCRKALAKYDTQPTQAAQRLSFHDWKQCVLDADGGASKHTREWYQREYGKYMASAQTVQDVEV